MAFSVFGLCFGVGMIAGPCLGGLLQHPVENGLIPNCEFLKYYPYFLPCAISSVVSWIGFLVGLFFLPETCKRGYKTIPEEGNDVDDDEDEDEIRTSIITLRQSISSASPDDQIVISSQICSKSIRIGLAYGLLCLQSIIFTEGMHFIFDFFSVSIMG